MFTFYCSSFIYYVIIKYCGYTRMSQVEDEY